MACGVGTRLCDRPSIGLGSRKTGCHIDALSSLSCFWATPPIFLSVAGNIVLLGGPLSLASAVAKRKITQAAAVFGLVPRFPSLTFALTFSQ